MSQAPSEIIGKAEPRAAEGFVDLSGFLDNSGLVRQVEQDRLSLGLYRMQERAKRLRGVTDPTKFEGIDQVVSLLGDDYLLQQYSESFRRLMISKRPILTRGQDEAVRVGREIAEFDERSPIRGSILDFVSGVATVAQEFGLAGWQVAGTVLQVTPENPLFPRTQEAGKLINEIADDYRARVMSGESDDVGSLIQSLNVRAGNDTWGRSIGKLMAQALPSLGIMMGGTNNARRAFAGVLGAYSTYSAGMGIEKYRHEEISNGRAPDAATAMLVGLGYGVTEFLTEKIDAVVPWSDIATGAAAKIGEAILRRQPGKVSRYITNAAGYAFTEGMEEVLAGEAQELIDLTMIDGKYDLTLGDRLESFGMGAAGSAVIAAAGVSSPAFREMMTQEPTALSRSGVDRAMTDRVLDWLRSEQGRPAAIGQAFRSVGTPSAAGPEEVAPGAALREYSQALRAAGVTAEPQLLPVEQLTPAQRNVIEGWSKRGITVIPIAPDPSNPLAAFATSQKGVVLVEMTPNAKVNDVLTEVGWMAHEAAHVLKAERPDIYGAFVEAAAPSIMAAAREYANMAQQQGVDVGLDSIDRIVDEGGALLFQAMIERTGLVSTLAQNELGVVRAITDFVRRVASRVGARGVATKAVFDAMKAVESSYAFRPVQPAADIVEGIKPLRFAVKPPSSHGADPRAMLRALSTQLSKRIVGLDTDFAALRGDMAEWASHFGTSSLPLRSLILQAQTPGQLGRALRTALTETVTRYADQMTSERAAQVRRGFEDRIKQVKQFATARERSLDDLRDHAATVVKAMLPPELQGRFVQAVTKVKTQTGLNRLFQRVQAALTKAELRKARESVKNTLKKLRKATLDPEQKAAVAAIRDSYGPIALLDAGQLNLLASEIDAALRQTRQEQSIENLARAAERKVQADAIAAETVKIAKADRKAEKRRLGEIDDEQLNKRKLLRLPVNMAVNGLLKPDQMGVYAFGENSVGHQVFHGELDRNGDRRLSKAQADEDYSMAAIEAAGLPLGSLELAQASRQLAKARSGRTKPIIYTLTLESGQTLEATSFERVSLIGGMMNPGTRALMEGGTPFTNRATGKTYTFTADDVLAIQGWATNAEYLIANALFERYNGSNAADLRAWSVEARGYDITEENHWPRSRHLDETPLTADWNDQNLQRASLLQEKTADKTKPVYFDDAIKVFLNHSWRVASITTLDPPITNARKILATKEVQDALKLSRTANISKYYEEYLNDLAAEGLGAPAFAEQPGGFASAAHFLTRKASTGFLFLNPDVIGYQIGGLLNSATKDVGLANVLWAAIGRGALFNTSIDQILRTDPWLRNRMETTGYGVISESAVAQRKVGGFRDHFAIIKNLVAKIDHAVTRAVFDAYRRKIQRADPNLTKDEVNTQALAATNQNIKFSQPTFDLMHMSGIARHGRKHGLSALFSMFQSQVNTNLNMIVNDVLRAKRNPTPRNMAVAMRTTGYVAVVNALWVQFVRDVISAGIGGAGGEDRDERMALLRYGDSIVSQAFGLTYYTNWFSGLASRHFERNIPRGTSFSPVMDSGSRAAEGMSYLTVDLFKRTSNFALNTQFDVDNDQMLKSLDNAITGLAPLGGLPVAPYRIIKRIVRPRLAGPSGGPKITSRSRGGSRSSRRSRRSS